jgi:hypothetical protein
MSKFEKYTIPIVLGSIGDMQAEWMTKEDWDRHKEDVKRLKAEGKFGEIEEVTIHMVTHPLFDDKLKTPAPESYRYDILDLSKKEKDE